MFQKFIISKIITINIMKVKNDSKIKIEKYRFFLKKNMFIVFEWWKETCNLRHHFQDEADICFIIQIDK